jgi:hypothetical protein
MGMKQGIGGVRAPQRAVSARGPPRPPRTRAAASI